MHYGAVLPDVRRTWPAPISEADHHRPVAMRDGPEWDLHRNTTRTRYLLTGLASTRSSS